MFLFGTPHQGLDLEEMIDVETDDQKPQIKRNLLVQLGEGSEYLENQKEDLLWLREKYHGKIVTFYETRRTSVKKVCRYRSVFLSYFESSVFCFLCG